MNQFYPRFPEPRPNAVRPNTRWDPNDQADVTAHSKKLRARLDIPREQLDEAICQMHQDGYSGVDIASTFGVTRERARQWLARMGLRTDGALRRKWSEKLSQFVPCSADIYKANTRSSQKGWRARRIEWRKNWLAEKLKQYVTEHGYVPGSTEFCESITGFGSKSALTMVCGGLGRRRGYNHQQAIVDIYTRAGYAKPLYGAESLDGVRIA